MTMRLTLRTMLAYLDEILEPEDAQALGKKIDESEFASNLVHKIRGVTRRLRLGAPKLEGKGMGADANSVAEYLDNTLPHERIADFEKVCLESDVQLAEVASSHQILALVLGEPAEVEASVRERMYRIDPTSVTGSAAGTGTAGSVSAGSVPTGSAAANKVGQAVAAAVSVAAPLEKAAAAARPPKPPRRSRRDRAEVPEYLRAGRRRVFVPVMVALLLLVGLGIGIVRLIGPLDHRHPVIGKLFTAPSEDLASDTSSRTKTLEFTKPGDKGTPPAATGATPPVSPTTPAIPTDIKQPEIKQPEIKQPDIKQPEEETDPLTPPITDTVRPPVPSRDPIPEIPAKTPVTPPAEKPVDPSTPPAEVKPADVKPVTPLPPPIATETKPEVPATGAKPADPIAVASLPTKPIIPDPSAKPVAAADVARFISVKQVLGRWDGKQKEWMRVAPQTLLSAEDALLVLPTYRCELNLLASGVSLALGGPALARIDSPDAEGTPQLTLQYGSAQFQVSKPATKIGLQLAAHRGTATLATVDSALAVEVTSWRAPGSDPEKAAPVSIVRIYCQKGQAVWREAGASDAPLEAGQVRVLIDGQPAKTMQVSGKLEWFDDRPLKEIDHRASQDLEPQIVPSRPISLSLEERSDEAQERRVEIRSLAIRCLAHFGRYDSSVRALSDEKLKSYWDVHVDSLNEVLARGAEASADLRTSLERLRGDQAAIVYRLLWGYEPDDLKDVKIGDGAKLVDYLNHDALDIRVLAIENLRRITGATLLYRPEFVAARRRPTVQRWVENLQANKIAYKVPPELPALPPPRN